MCKCALSSWMCTLLAQGSSVSCCLCPDVAGAGVANLMFCSQLQSRLGAALLHMLRVRS